MVVVPTTAVLTVMSEARTVALKVAVVLAFQLSVNLCITHKIFAQRFNTDSLQIILSAQPKKEQLRTFRILATAFRETNPKRAIGVAIRALQVARELEAQAAIIDFELLLGSLYTQTRTDTLLARQHLEQGLNRAREQGNDSLISKGLLELGRYYLSMENPRRAITSLDQGLELTNERNQPRLAAEMNTAMADAYKALGIYPHATDYYLKALRLAEMLRDDLATAELSNNIGTVYRHMGDDAHAVEYFDAARQIYESSHDSGGVVRSLLNTGEIYQQQNKYQKAIDIYVQALATARDLKHVDKEATVTAKIGTAMALQGNLKEGLGYLGQALALQRTSGNVKGSLDVLNDIAHVNIQLKDATGAKAAAEDVIRLAPEYEAWDQLSHGYLNLSRSYKLLEDYRNAHHFLEKHNILKDSLSDIREAQITHELQVHYDTEKKDMAIRSLHQEKQIASARRNNYILGATLALLIVASLYSTATKALRFIATKARRH